MRDSISKAVRYARNQTATEMLMPAALNSPRIDALRGAPPDAWIALSEDESRIIASGATYDEVVQKSQEMGVEEPILIKTPKNWLSFSV
jgi:hypothetical protein